MHRNSRTLVGSIWASLPKDQTGAPSIERTACWEMILGDAELVSLVGNADMARGKA